MERRVTVNDRIERVELEVPEDLEPVEASEEPPKLPDDRSAYGPCLYLGPAGERCAKAAVEGGYCTKHHPVPARQAPGRSYTRVVVATIALVVIVWPYVIEAVRELSRWLAEAR